MAGYSVTGEEFLTLWNCTELRQFIVDEAKKRNKLPQLQEEYCQEAWLLISCSPAGYDVEAYQDLAYKAIYSSWWQSKKEYALTQSMTQHFENKQSQSPEAVTDNDTGFMSHEHNEGRRY